MRIRFHGSPAVTRLIVGPAGEDSKISTMDEVIDVQADARSPWVNLGVAQDNPMLTVRSGLRAIVFHVTGDWPVLEEAGIGIQIALVVLVAKEGSEVIAWTAPVEIEYTEVIVTNGGETYRGRIDIGLMGAARALEVPQ